MAWRSVKDVARLDLELEPVAIFDNPSTTELISDVVELAALGACNRTYMLGPAPMWCESLLAERDAADRDEIDEPFIELVALISVIESSHDTSSGHELTMRRCSKRPAAFGARIDLKSV